MKLIVGVGTIVVLLAHTVDQTPSVSNDDLENKGSECSVQCGVDTLGKTCSHCYTL